LAGADAVLQTIAEGPETVCLVRKFCAEQPQTLACFVKQSLAHGGISAVDELLEALGLLTGYLAATRVIRLMALLGQECLHVRVLREKRLGLAAPGLGEFGEGLLHLVRLDHGRLGNGLCLMAERALVHTLGFLADAPCFDEAFFELSQRGGNTVVEGEIAGGRLASAPAQFLDLGNGNHQVAKPG
jgi:hypothetical protein